MPLRCLIVEDEPAQQKHIKGFIEEMKNELEYVATFNNVNDTFEYVQNNEIDLIFLDLELSGRLSGIDLLAKIEETQLKLYVIITSAFRDLRGDTVEYNISGYLNKPFNFVKFQSRINVLLESINLSTPKNEENISFSFFNVITINAIIRTKIEYNKIKYISVSGNNSTFYMENNELLKVCISLLEIENIIPEQFICRIGRKLIIGNRKWINSYERRDNILTIENLNITFAVGRMYLEDFLNYMNRLERTNKKVTTTE